VSADARRIEELGLNSSAPPGQLLYDGWLLRLLPGKAKRARSVNAIYASTLAVEEKIAYCERLYAQAGLPLLFRMTPFVQPEGLDGHLQQMGFERFEATAVESATIDPATFAMAGAREAPLEQWVHAVGELRGSPAGHVHSHFARLRDLPLPKRAFCIEEGGAVVATGLTIVEDGHAGLFDIVTRPDQRRRGCARRIVASLLKCAHEDLGAMKAYLQVEAGNAPARSLYARFGFAERYQYWYRGRPGVTP
jgi:ribosomal protein S18 acetylase RimI-like enzyme